MNGKLRSNLFFVELLGLKKRSDIESVMLQMREKVE